MGSPPQRGNQICGQGVENLLCSWLLGGFTKAPLPQWKKPKNPKPAANKEKKKKLKKTRKERNPGPEEKS